MGGTLAAGTSGRETLARGLWITGEAMGGLAPPVGNGRGWGQERSSISSQRPGTASSRTAMNTTRWPRRRTTTASTSPGWSSWTWTRRTLNR
jgi:hypothetical protein